MMKRILTVSFCALALALSWQATALAAESQISLNEMVELLKQTPEKGGYMLIDSRPEVKYVMGHLPYAETIPVEDMPDYMDELPKDKNALVVFYCGGVTCQKSAKAAKLAVANGYTNVRVFTDGEPAWQAAGQDLWVSAGYIKMILNDRDRIAVFVDARPDVKYYAGTLPGAIHLPSEQFDKLKGLLPADKSIEIITFCGGLKCQKSHKLAAMARKEGYQNVKIYAYGYPNWKTSSTRAFAMINPKEGGQTVAGKPEQAFPGEISKSDFEKLLKEKPAGFLLVDVRPDVQFQEGHIPGSINILDEVMKDNLDKIRGAENVVFYCSTGARAAVAYYAAEDAGFKKTRYLNRAVLFGDDGSFDVR